MNINNSFHIFSTIGYNIPRSVKKDIKPVMTTTEKCKAHITDVPKSIEVFTVTEWH